MTSRSEALVVTARPARYGKQLVAHLSRHNSGDWSDSDQRGWIEFADGRAELAAHLMDSTYLSREIQTISRA